MARGDKSNIGFRIPAFGFYRAQDGSIAVEFGYMLPVLLLLALTVGEAAMAISEQMSVQSAARAGTHFGLEKPPVQGDMQPIINSVKAAMPAGWSGEEQPTITAKIVCECEFTGPVQCGASCGKDERTQSFLQVDVTKRHSTMFSFQGWKPSVTLKNTSIVRLQ